MTKALMRLGIEEMYHTIIKAIYGDKLKPFPLNSGIRQGCSVSPLLGNIVLELLARIIRHEEEKKRIQIGKV
jgi:hypothetical protein